MKKIEQLGMSFNSELPNHLHDFWYKNSKTYNWAYSILGHVPNDVGELEILLSRYHDLHLDSRIATTTTPDKKWRMLSAMQKAIRRGNSVIAARAAHALQGLDEEHTWRRLAIIALEDIGLGDPIVCAIVLHAASAKAIRNSYNHSTLIVSVATMMAEAVKSRILTNLLITCMEKDMSGIVEHLKSCNLEQEVQDTGNSLLVNTVAWWQIAGTQRYPNDRLVPQYQPKKRFIDAIQAADVPFMIQYMAIRGSKSMQDALFLPLIPLWQHLSNPNINLGLRYPVLVSDPVIAGVLAATFDKYSSEGKRAFAYFSKSCQPIRQFFDKYPTLDKIKMLGYAVFKVDSQILSPELDFPQRKHLNDAMWVIHSKGVVKDYSVFLELVGLVKSNIKALTDARQRIVVGK